MQPARKLALALATALLLPAAPTALAQWTPTKPVDVIVHTGPGGGNDVLARAIATMAEKEKLLPVRMNVINKPGGNGAVAAAALEEKKGDPNTIGLITSVWIAGPLTSKEAKITVNDLKPIANLLLEPAVVAVRADSPYQSVKDLVEAAKSKPMQLKQSGGSVTSRDNIFRLQMQHATGARWAFVSFPGGGERLAALLGGHVDFMVIEPQEAGEQVRAGKLRVLAQLTAKRLAGYPDTPTLKEAGYDVKTTPQIRAAVAPPGQPEAASKYWEGFFARLHETASWKKYVADNQLEDEFAPAATLRKSVADIESQLREAYTQAGVKVVR